jgi:hypothetical protein
MGTEWTMKPAKLDLPVLILAAAILGGSTALPAQTFNSGSNGSDGALDLTGQTGTLVFNPATFNPPLDPDHDNVYHFTTITIPANLTVRLGADLLGAKPIVWLATGAVQINGTLDLSGSAGNGPQGIQIAAVAGAGGYAGGVGGMVSTSAQPGQGPGGGTTPGAGAGYAFAGTGPSNTVGGPAYGNPFLLPIVGGSGGAGGQYYGPAPNPLGAEGGGGGGAILIASSDSISLSGGILTVKGGAGACNTGDQPSFQSSGGGSGGAIRLMAPRISGSGILEARGGASCNGGGVGSVGRIRLEAFTQSLTGQVNPAPTSSPPGLVFPPASAPSVSIVSIGGVAVPANPTASFITPDVTLDNATTVTIQLAASKVPVGTVVHLTLTPETGAIVNVDSTPLAGTFDASTATASMTLPHGFSRFSVQASWTP